MGKSEVEKNVMEEGCHCKTKPWVVFCNISVLFVCVCNRMGCTCCSWWTHLQPPTLWSSSLSSSWWGYPTSTVSKADAVWSRGLFDRESEALAVLMLVTLALGKETWQNRSAFKMLSWTKVSGQRKMFGADSGTQRKVRRSRKSLGFILHGPYSYQINGYLFILLKTKTLK